MLIYIRVNLLQSDFALLELKQVLTFANQVYSACLNVKQSQQENECLTTGWIIKESSKFTQQSFS
jgi:hypothetical protein